MGLAPATAERRRILLVDDVEFNRILTEAVLHRGAYDVDSVADGMTALAALEERLYDLVLMNLDMPGIDGHETATAIRRRSRNPVKLVAFSARGDAVSRLRSGRVGMCAHITRPIAPRDLLQEIDLLLGQPPVAERPDPWQRELYDEWVVRLGAERMHGFLSKLLEQFRSLLVALTKPDDAARDDLHRMAHDVSSTGGMLGFSEVTHCCRELLEAVVTDTETQARPTLVTALERAVLRLEDHLLADEPQAVAA